MNKILMKHVSTLFLICFLWLLGGCKKETTSPGSRPPTPVPPPGDASTRFSIRAGGAGVDRGHGIQVDSEGNTYLTGTVQGVVDFGDFNRSTTVSSRDVFVAKLNESGTFQWAKTVGGSNNDDAYDIKLDPSGNLYVLGEFERTISFGANIQLTSKGKRDVFVLKMDKDGDYIWAVRAGGTEVEHGNSLWVDASHVYVTGQFQGAASFVADANTLTSSGFQDLYVWKLTTGGAHVWAKKAGSPSTTPCGSAGQDPCNDEGWGVSADAEGNVYATGCFSGTATFLNANPKPKSVGGRDIFVWKLSKDGENEWVKGVGGEDDDIGLSIWVGDAGHVYASGQFKGGGKVRFSATKQLESHGLEDIYVWKLSKGGTHQWVQQAGGSSHDYGIHLVVDKNENIYLGGGFSGTATFGDKSYPSAGQNDVYVWKLNKDGVHRWLVQAGGTRRDEARRMALDGAGHIHVTGSFEGSANYGGGTALAARGSTDIFIYAFKDSE